MLRKLRENDIDNIMELWKKESIQSNKFLKKVFILNNYTKKRDDFLKNINSTLIYSEDGKIEAAISIDDVDEISSIFVENKIRREGIGSILLNACKKKYKELSVKIYKKNNVAISFFLSNGFCKLGEEIEKESNEVKYILKWSKKEKVDISLIYLDNDIQEELTKKYQCKKNIEIKNINLNKILEEKKDKNKEKGIKLYLDIRKTLEENIINNKIILYINYNNFNKEINELIEEIVKIKKVELKVIICKPLSIEPSKKNEIIEEVKKIYKDYKVYVFDYNFELKDLNIKDIFYKRTDEMLQNIEKIVEIV